MPVSPYRPHRSIFITAIFILLASMGLTACDQIVSSSSNDVQPIVDGTGKVNENLFLVQFQAELPAALDDGETLYLDIVDEVTGLALNATRYELESDDDSHYSAEIALLPNSVTKYRYVKEGKTTAVEYTSQKRQVRYRMYYAEAPGEVQDKISAWNDRPFTGLYGRIIGQVVLEGDNHFAAGSLVSVGGQHTYTAADGSFFVDQLPVGTHNLVVYSPDGSHKTFQQGALVAAESTTPAIIRVTSSKLVEITFHVNPPEGSPTGIPIRLVGNTFGLGNSFGDLRGGLSTLANRAPQLVYSEDGSYSVRLQLPVGFEIQYKYSLGDGFWNAELFADGRPRLRRFIVPERDSTIRDQIDSWNTPGLAAVTFLVATPSTTPLTDQISIQFNPYGWTEPIPMWPIGEGKWAYILYSPLNFIGETGYRFCRNEQCGIADNAETIGADGRAPTFSPAAEAQIIEVSIAKWMWVGEETAPITVPSYEIAPKPENFSSGIELAADYHPSWQPYLAKSFLRIKQIESEWVVLSPTWHWLSTNPPALAPVSGLDSSWQDLSQSIRLAQAAGLKVAVRPTTAFSVPTSVWWSEAELTDGWWQTWFDRYRLLILNAADTAQQTGAEALILGDESLLPSLPGGAIGNRSSAPYDAQQRWESLLGEIRQRYSGSIIWRSTGLGQDQIPDLVSQMDGLFVVCNHNLSESEIVSPDELEKAWVNYFENELRSVRDRLDKPIWVGLAYPSVDQAASGCVKSGESCIPANVFAQAGLDIPGTSLDMVEQAEIYNAAFRAVNNNDWISGIFSAGYYPVVTLQDKSISVSGKPAEDVIWYWFDQFMK